MADQARAGRGLRLGDGQEAGGVLERGRNCPADVVREPKPPKNREMDVGSKNSAVGYAVRCDSSNLI